MLYYHVIVLNPYFEIRRFSIFVVVHGDESAQPNIATVYALFDINTSAVIGSRKSNGLISSESGSHGHVATKGTIFV